LSIKDKINFLQLSRFSAFCEQFFRIHLSSQARSENKLNFHFNAALTTVNLAKIDWINSKHNDEMSFSNKRIIQELIQWGKIAA
jgi:hypothetical protein